MKPVAVLLWIAAASFGQSVDIRDVVEQALDQPVELELTNVTVVEAFAHISEQTGVEITASAATLARLPHGPETIISATLADIPLRDGLEELFAHLAMTYENIGRGIAVSPTDAALRVGRRLTWPELDTLYLLSESRWSQSSDRLEALHSRIQFRVSDVGPWTRLRAAIEQVGAGRGDEVLDLACKNLGWTWYPSGVEIVVLEKSDQVRRQLGRMVSLRHRERALVDVLDELSRQIGVPIRTEPGLIARLPRQTRDRLTLITEGMAADETLRAICDATGLEFRVEANGVTFYATEDLLMTAMTSAPVMSDPYVATIRVPLGTGGIEFEIFVRESDLTPECRRLLEAQKRQTIAALEAELRRQAAGN